MLLVALRSRGKWLPAGVLYLGVPCIALIWLRIDTTFGRDAVLWLMVVVWAADTGAYAAGRTIGGPLLIPRISPRKTWAGLVGGLVFAVVTSMAFTQFDGEPQTVQNLMLAAAFGLLIGITAQLGDLTESWIKRRFGVKDASTLIPGHGGLLDRVDGLMAAIVMAACLVATGEGALFAWL